MEDELETSEQEDERDGEHPSKPEAEHKPNTQNEQDDAREDEQRSTNYIRDVDPLREQTVCFCHIRHEGHDEIHRCADDHERTSDPADILAFAFGGGVLLRLEETRL